MNFDTASSSEEDITFIRSNLKADPVALSLKFQGDAHKRFLIGQIRAHQQIRKKVPAWYGTLQLRLPGSLPLQQASSEDTSRLKASLISGDHLLDITGGLGIDSFFLSASFNHTTYVEKDPELAQLAEHNFKVLKSPIHVMCDDGIEVLRTSDADVVYADPYRRDEHNQKMVSFSSCQPDVTGHLDLFCRTGRTSLIKASPMLDINEGLRQLEQVHEVWVISVRNECRELIFVLRENSSEPLIRTFNLTPVQTESFQFSQKAGGALPALAMPGSYLYEPNASVLKARGQDRLAVENDLHKLHPQSNFFTSEELLSRFPGKIFTVQEVLKPWDKKLKGGRFNVISRNFPEKANIIEQKLKLKPDKSRYLIATRLQNGEYSFIVGELLPTPY